MIASKIEIRPLPRLNFNFELWYLEGGRPRETTEASSRAQIQAQETEASLLPTQPGPLKLRLFWGSKKEVHQIHINVKWY